ncbi:MAG: hypothetical protein IPN86_04795 [Saprospiraceae bacterium]|nr:hypothetical protein [Saprospiraceae bacterium]
MCYLEVFFKANAQQKEEPIKVVEVSGKVVFLEDDKGNPAASYTKCGGQRYKRGAYTEYDGFFFGLVAL